MAIALRSTKLIVADVAAAERFYVGLGMTVVGYNVGGEGVFRQEHAWLASPDRPADVVLILMHLPELPLPPVPAYPAEVWLAFAVDDVDATVAEAVRLGGAVIRPGTDEPTHGVRAAIVTDADGHVIELVGPPATR